MAAKVTMFEVLIDFCARNRGKQKSAFTHADNDMRNFFDSMGKETVGGMGPNCPANLAFCDWVSPPR